MKLKSVISAVLGAVLLCGASGCSIANISKEDMLRPPKTIGNEAEIEKLIAKSAPDGYTLKYPKSGSNRSAITMHDLDGDDKDEAIVFFREKNSSTGIRMLVMYEKDDGQWETAGDYVTETTDVDCLDFADITGVGSQEILVGYATYTAGVNFLSVYTFTNGVTETIEAGQNYSSFYCGALDGSGISNVITLTLFTAENDAKATLLEYDSSHSALTAKASVAMDANIVSFRSAAFSELSDSIKGLVIDGNLANGEMNTQVIYYNKQLNVLRNPLYKEKEDNPTQRGSEVLSADIDNDMKYEIPTVSALPFDQSSGAFASASQVIWNKFSAQKEQLLPCQRTVANLQFRYMIKIPESWKTGSFTAILNQTGTMMSVCEWNSLAVGERLFDIMVFKVSDWDHGKSSDQYTLIYKDNRYAYAFLNYHTQSSLAMSDNEIKTAFSLLGGASSAGSQNTKTQ